jgi:branched-chain amino acid transport system ATP-binding protein
MLKLTNVHAYYGNRHIIKGINLHIQGNAIVTLIGTNGVGKSTLLNSICGLVDSITGSIGFKGNEIGHLPSYKIAKMGISYVPERRQLFRGLTTWENLQMGSYARRDPAGVKEDLEWVLKLFPILKERKIQMAESLSGGEQQMLAVSRALMSRPKLLLLDEPSLGLAPILIEAIFEVFKEINANGTAILLVEQNARKALAVASEGYVMEGGVIALHGQAEELMSNEQVQMLYLGVQRR